MEKESRKSSFIVQGGILAITGILVRIIGMLYRIPMVNIIGSDGNGIYGAAYNIYNIVLILSSYGMPMAVSKMISARLVKKEYRNAGQIFKQAIIVAAISGGIAACVLFFGAGLIENVLYRGIPGTAIPLRILAPTVFIVAILGTIRGFFEGHGTMTQTAVSQFVEQIVNAIVSVAASFAFMRAFSGRADQAAHGAAGGTLGICLGAAAGLAVVVVILIRNAGQYRANLRSDTNSHVLDTRSTYRTIMMTIVPILLGQTFYNISAVIDDIIYNNVAIATMPGNMVATTLGNYNTSYSTLISIPMGIAGAMASSLLPSVVNSYEMGSAKAIRKKLRHTVHVTMLIAIPFTIALTVLGEPIIRLLFSRYDALQGDLMLKTGAAAIIFYTLATITSTTLQGVDRMRLPVIHSAIALAIHIPLVIILLLTTRLGTIALVIGAMAFSVTVFILNLRSLRRIIGYRQEYIKTFLIPLICSCVMGIGALPVYRGLYILIRHNLPCLIASAFVGIVIYFAGLMYAKKKGIY